MLLPDKPQANNGHGQWRLLPCQPIGYHSGVFPRHFSYMQGVYMTSRSLAAKVICLIALLFIAGQCAAQPPAGKKAAAGAPQNPFAKRLPAPEFPQNVAWFNTKKPLKKEDLKGKFVLL